MPSSEKVVEEVQHVWRTRGLLVLVLHLVTGFERLRGLLAHHGQGGLEDLEGHGGAAATAWGWLVHGIVGRGREVVQVSLEGARDGAPPELLFLVIHHPGREGRAVAPTALLCTHPTGVAEGMQRLAPQLPLLAPLRLRLTRAHRPMAEHGGTEDSIRATGRKRQRAAGQRGRAMTMLVHLLLGGAEGVRISLRAGCTVAAAAVGGT